MKTLTIVGAGLLALWWFATGELPTEQLAWAVDWFGDKLAERLEQIGGVEHLEPTQPPAHQP